MQNLLPAGMAALQLGHSMLPLTFRDDQRTTEPAEATFVQQVVLGSRRSPLGSRQRLLRVKRDDSALMRLWSAFLTKADKATSESNRGLVPFPDLVPHDEHRGRRELRRPGLCVVGPDARRYDDEHLIT